MELLPKTPLAKGYRLKFNAASLTASTQAKQLVESLRSDQGWKEVFVNLPEDKGKTSIRGTGPFEDGNCQGKKS